MPTLDNFSQSHSLPGENITIESQREHFPEFRHSGSSLTVRIRDRGPGVPEANLPHIFRAFYRVDMARQGTTGGFGVGLAIAERAVHLHAGRIEVSNRAEGGLEVRVTLPCLVGARLAPSIKTDG